MNHHESKVPLIPAPIAGLAAIAANLSWSWCRDARQLFASIDRPLWRASRHNPLELLHRADPTRLAECAVDEDFLRRYHAVRLQLDFAASTNPTWFASSFQDLGQPTVAYFCAEFALHNSVPIYSGGLGILAGDHCKAASDLGVPLVGVGLMYTRGYFDQRIRLDGWQEDSEEIFDPGLTPLTPVLDDDGEPYLTTVQSFGRTVHVGAWKMMVGRIPVYLLDTDLEGNDPADCQLCHKLYAGGPELRVRQEWVLGVGGVRVLRALGIHPAAWHTNEGHAAFMLLERTREFTSEGASFDDAVREVRKRSVFTTHTPVRAGHDVFSPDLLERCTGPFWQDIGVEKAKVFGLGSQPEHDDGAFHMTAMALRLSGHVNGVSAQHGAVTREIWRSLWPDRPIEKVPIGHVTNGVHLASWMSHNQKRLFDEHLQPGWEQRVDEPDFWDGVLDLDDTKLWDVHLRLKSHLLDFIREEARQRWRNEWADVSHLAGAGPLLSSRILTIGFARRFATYKRATLLLHDPERLRRLLVDPRRPVQLIFAGKAHPADDPGKRLIQRVFSLAHDRSFEGRIAFLEDYEMHMAHRMVEGVDLWLNVPTVPLEACGTSGIKAALNGIPQLSTLTGWWAEGYSGHNGWALQPSESNDGSDAADANRLYDLLEGEVIPLFYDRDAAGIPREWIQRMKHAIREAGRGFTASRMLREYVSDYYVPAIRNGSGDDPPAG